ncbi:MAG: hypothetical protein GX575_21530 [Candidatus Anammoximicrobium sp.]|nr:hypothetical protein [Candidatus Anammoximicrobium sp.]
MDKVSSLDEARAAKALAAKAFRRRAQVVGVGITRVGTGYGLKVNLSGQSRGAGPLPSQIAGVPVRVEVVGKIRKRTS